MILAGTTESGGPNFLSEGDRPTQNSFLIDGVESRIQREGGYGLNLSVEAIDEFKVMQNSFSAEYGRATTIVNAVVRSGTNALHGSVFVLKAGSQQTIAEEGVTTGGPVRKVDDDTLRGVLLH